MNEKGEKAMQGVDALARRAAEVVVRKQSATTRILRDELRVKVGVAQALLTKLQALGVVDGTNVLVRDRAALEELLSRPQQSAPSAGVAAPGAAGDESGLFDVAAAPSVRDRR